MNLYAAEEARSVLNVVILGMRGCAWAFHGTNERLLSDCSRS